MIYIMSFNLGSIWSSHSNKKRNIREHKIIPKLTHPNLNPNPHKNSKKYWGTPTWYLFHTIAARVNENFYNSNYHFIWGFIKECCATLPCPYCRQHAMDFTKNISFDMVSTKKKLQDILFEFHNNVNKRTGNKVENINILKKYNNTNIVNIFKLFEQRFFKSYIGSRQFDDWIKNKFKKIFKEFKKKLNGNFT